MHIEQSHSNLELFLKISDLFCERVLLKYKGRPKKNLSISDFLPTLPNYMLLNMLKVF